MMKLCNLLRGGGRGLLPQQYLACSCTHPEARCNVQLTKNSVVVLSVFCVLMGSTALHSFVLACLETTTTNTTLFVHRSDGHAMLMSLDKGEAAVYGFHCASDMTLRMR